MNTPNTSSESETLAKEDQMLLSVLEEIEKNPTTSQRKIANELGMAVGLVNAIFKRVVSKGFVKIKRLNSRNVRYLLTSNGLFEKSRLSYRYLRNSIQYVWRYRNEVHQLLEPLAQNGVKKIVIYGSGEEAELAFLAMQELGMEIEAIVDPSTNKEKCLGRTVLGMDWMKDQKKIDALLILFSKNEDKLIKEFVDGKKSKVCNIENKLCVNF